MTERPTAGAPATNFCSQCGARLAPDARFCSGCGRPVAPSAVGAPPDVAAAPETGRTARSLREQAPGLAVLTLFLAVGLALWVGVLRPGTPAPSAPTRPGDRQAPPAGNAGVMPPDHPPTQLPEEAKKFVASLVEKANAAPNDVAAWKSLAQVQTRAAEIDPSYAAAALESYQHVLGIAPDDLEAIRGLGNVYYDQQQFPKASAQYERYLQAKPDDPSVRTDLATTYLYQRQLDRAIETYQKVIAAHPDFLQAHFNLGLAYEAAGKRDLALASLAKAKTLAPDDATREQVERVTQQLTSGGGARIAAPAGGADRAGAAGGAGTADAGAGGATAGGAPPPPPGDSPHGGAAAAAGQGGVTGGGPRASGDGAAASATDFRGAVEAGLRAHPILGPKIRAVEWPSARQARVSVADFPMSAMPEFARNLFRARLETILDDAQTRFGGEGESAIELVDAANGATMERVTH
jgi:tetratricopeptide (TPR) repeat protein